MTNIIEEFYYGNIEPQEMTTELRAKLRNKLAALSKTEEEISGKLTEAENELFDKYLQQSGEFLCVSNAAPASFFISFDYLLFLLVHLSKRRNSVIVLGNIRIEDCAVMLCHVQGAMTQEPLKHKGIATAVN